MPKALFILTTLCIALSGALVLYSQQGRISQEVLDLFPHNDSKVVIEAHRHFGSSKYVPIFLSNTPDSSDTSQALESISQTLLAHENTQAIITHNPPQTHKLYDFITHNSAYMLSQDSENEEIAAQSQRIFAPLLESMLKNMRENATPSPLFSDSTQGVMALVELKSLESSALKSSMELFSNLALEYPNMRYFSADFMRLANIDLILQEVNILLGVASVLFVVLYFVIIRIPFLTLSTIITLILSNTIAILATLCVYPKVTIMALSFGIGISNIAIDYMMHHHFFGLYASKGRTIFNRPVFLGYITTMIGLLACLFIPFPLLAQLSLYAMISLSISYVCFALLYPRIGFEVPRLYSAISRLRMPSVPSIAFLIIAMVAFIYAFSHIKLDFDLSKLDYENKPMLESRALFDHLSDKNQVQVLISADSSTHLMRFALRLLQEIKHISFHKKEGYIEPQSEAQGDTKSKARYYYLASLPLDKLEALDSIYTSFMAESAKTAKTSEALENGFLHIDTRPMQSIMDSLADDIYEPMVVVLFIALLLMLVCLYFSTKKAFISAAIFVLFPLSVALCVITSHSALNMMHLFALLILVVVSVDYGIYAIKEGQSPSTTHAILFSALTTGISFGMLILSHTKALNSFGEVIFSGMACILVMLVFARLKVA